MRKIIALFLIVGVNVALVGRGAGQTVPPSIPNGFQNGVAATSSTDLIQRLDAIVREAAAREPLVGVSVEVLRGQETLLRRGYGYSDLGLRATATAETTYRLLGPALAAAIMQQVEKGRLRLDEDATDLLREFPWQGRRVTVRQLMDSTSGLPDFHYLGDAHRALRAVPKASDEVTALFAGRPFTHEPGERWQWTISGLHLAGVLLERITGQRYQDYLREHIFKPAGLTNSFYCDDRTVVPGLARGYEAVGQSFMNYPLESATLYPFIAVACTSAADAASLMRALRDGRLMRTESYRLMTTSEGPARQTDRLEQRGVGLRMSREEGYRWVGERGSLMGFSSAVIDFPDNSLTVAVLSNTSGQAAFRIARSLARAVLGLPSLPAPAALPTSLPTDRVPLTAPGRSQYVGIYQAGWAGAPGPYQHWQSTFRVFEDNGRLMIQELGESPEPLLYQGDHTFRVSTWPAGRYVFKIREGRASGLDVLGSDFALSGSRIDNKWPFKMLMDR